MADSSVVRERIDTVVPEVTGLRRLLTPPTALLPRIRWLFTASAVGLTVLFGVVGAITAASAPATAGRPWVLALTPPIVLIALWLYGYRQQRFTLGMDVVCAAALVALGAALPDNRSMLAATYGSIWVRALYATPRQAAVSTALFVAAFVAAAVLSPAAPDLLGASVLGRAIIGLIFGVIFTLIGTVLATYQRAIVRERRLRRAGHALAEASTRQEIYDAALAGARGLLSTDAGDSHRGVELAIGSESSMAVVGAAGDGAERSIYTLPLVA
ncbi:MAG TPA: hypothetical protein VFN74_24290, partial [Chloroflexota bacterium]|nr:hypothetical protein [Chloroflexota bacterium]